MTGLLLGLFANGHWAGIDLCFERTDDQVRVADAQIDGEVEVATWIASEEAASADE